MSFERDEIIMYPEMLQLWLIDEDCPAGEYLHGEPVKRSPEKHLVYGERHDPDEGVQFIVAGWHSDDWLAASPKSSDSYQYVTALMKDRELYVQGRCYSGSGYHSTEDGIFAMCRLLNKRLKRLEKAA